MRRGSHHAYNDDGSDENPNDGFSGRSVREDQDGEELETPAVEIDNNLQILGSTPRERSPKIDCVKELIVVESKDTIDVPQVLAEEDKNPNVPE